MICDRCFQSTEEGEHGVGLCPFEPRRYAPTIWRDEIPGGIMIANGICHEDGTPKRFDSRSEIRKEAAAKGLVEWGNVYTEDRLKESKERAEWSARSSEAQRERSDRREMRREGIRPEMAAPPSARRREETIRIAREMAARR